MTKWSLMSKIEESIRKPPLFDRYAHYINLPLLPVCMQSTPSLLFFSLTCFDLIEARVSIGLHPEFSASANGIASNASANARIAYCSRPGVFGHTLDEYGR